MEQKVFSVCIIGGTGAEGGGLALRWAHAGHRVAIGSREADKAKKAANDLNRILGDERIVGFASKDGVAAAEIAVLTVPYTAQLATASAIKDDLRGKILIDVTVPLVPPKVSRVQLPPTNSCVLASSKCSGLRCGWFRLSRTFQRTNSKTCRTTSIAMC